MQKYVKDFNCATPFEKNIKVFSASIGKKS